MKSGAGHIEMSHRLHAETLERARDIATEPYFGEWVGGAVDDNELTGVALRDADAERVERTVHLARTIGQLAPIAEIDIHHGDPERSLTVNTYTLPLGSSVILETRVTRLSSVLRHGRVIRPTGLELRNGAVFAPPIRRAEQVGFLAAVPTIAYTLRVVSELKESSLRRGEYRNHKLDLHR